MAQPPSSASNEWRHSRQWRLILNYPKTQLRRRYSSDFKLSKIFVFQNSEETL
ncbi:unnamed protein product, partial [Nesidiocoris tenuis]